MGCSAGGQSGVRLLVSPGSAPAYKLSRAPSSFSGPVNLPAGHTRAPCLGPFRQHDSGSLHQSPRRSEVSLPLQVGSTPPILGIEQTPFSKRGSRARQSEPWRRHAVQRQCGSGRMDPTSSYGSRNLVSLLEGRGRPLCLRRQLSLPNLFLDTVRCSQLPASSGHQTGQGDEMLSSLGGPTLEEPGFVPRAALSSSPVDDTTETRSSLAGKRHDLAFPARAVEPSCMEPRREHTQLLARVNDTILEARAPTCYPFYKSCWTTGVPLPHSKFTCQLSQ